MHVDNDLSAYLDGELAPSDRARVESHLAGCDRCASRLAELRSTASLISALPSPRPSRSLVPRVVERWNWLRPIRSLSAVASGAFLFLFLVTAVARSGTGLGGGGAATTAFGPAGGAAAPAPQAAPAASLATAAPALVPAPAPVFDANRQAIAASPSPAAPPSGAAELAVGTRAASPTPVTVIYGTPAPDPFTAPIFWLALAMLAALAAIVAHWRVRTA